MLTAKLRRISRDFSRSMIALAVTSLEEKRTSLPRAAVVTHTMRTPHITDTAATILPKCVAAITFPPAPGVMLVNINQAEFTM